MTVKFTVGGAPFGKQRPRHNRYTNTTYTPKETTNHEALVAMIYRATPHKVHKLEIKHD